VPDARDGSIFRFDHFSGTIAMWDRSSHTESWISHSVPPGLAAQAFDPVAALCHLRPNRLLG